MADIDLKTLTPDTSINDSAVLFGADSQASTSPSVYAVSTVRGHIVGTANTFTQPQIVSVSSSSDALRITQTGAGNALVVEDEANPDATPFLVTGTGNVGIGTSSPAERLDVAGRIRSTPPAGGFAGLTMFTAAASGFAPGSISFTRASAAGGATPDNSSVGEFRFDGRDANGSYTVFALISAEMFTNAAGGAPGSMSFSISASGASSQERMRLTASGLGIGSTSFGTSAQRVLSIGTGVAPTTGPADTIQIYSTDLSAGNTILSLYTEGTPVNSNTTAAATHRIAVRINGTVYYLLANTAA